MKKIKIQTPAKINLTLEIVNKRDDGFHNIQSIMQLIDLYDYLTIIIEPSDKNEIVLTGTSNIIPYNEKNLVWKAAELFYNNIKYKETYGEKPYKTSVHIDKNIPISAGLAGGSTNAAGTIFGLNTLFENLLSKEEMHNLCKELGSDLNVCLEGGCLLATGRGEVINKLPFRNYSVSLIKPDKLGISAKEAYTKYSLLERKPQYDMTSKMVDAIKIGTDITQFLYNDLETAVFDDYKELQTIKKLYPKSIMSGSGSTYYALNQTFKIIEGYTVYNNLNFIPDGVKIKT